MVSLVDKAELLSGGKAGRADDVEVAALVSDARARVVTLVPDGRQS